jgi:hypothetical protein
LYIKKKKNIPVFGEVKQTINIPTIVDRLVKRLNAPKAFAVGCLDQQEYSLIKI